MPDTQRPPVEKVVDHDIGVYVGKDKFMGKFRIRLTPDMEAEAFREVLADKLKPILYTKHKLQGEDGREGPEVYFHWNNDEKDWEMQYRFNQKDAAGANVLDAEGKPQKAYYTKQVEQIAQRTAQSLTDVLHAALGRARDDGPGF